MSDIETTDVDMFTIGNNLRELREQKRVTQMQVVDVLGVSYTHYAKIEVSCTKKTSACRSVHPGV